MWRNCFLPFSSGWWEKTWLRVKGGPRGRAGRAQLVGVPGVPGTVPTPWARDTGREHVTVQASSLFRYRKARQSGHGCHGREGFSAQLPCCDTAVSTGHSMPWGKGHTGKLQGQWTAAQVQAQEPLLLFPWEGAGEAERAGLGLSALCHFRALGHRSCLWSSE